MRYGYLDTIQIFIMERATQAYRQRGEITDTQVCVQSLTTGETGIADMHDIAGITTEYPKGV